MKEFDIIKKAIKKVAKNIFFKGSKKINLKGSYDFFTDNDLASEQYFIKIIKKYFPKDHILGEETCNDTKLENRTWIIDPIDGTHNYANGLKECGIQVAFYDNGETKFSIIYLPYYDELYTCIKGQGVYLNNKRIETYHDIEISSSMIALSTLTHDDKVKNITLDCFSKLNDGVLDIRIVGCGCWEFTSMIQKCFGAYVLIRKDIKKWDLLPGILMCEENNLVISNKIYKGFEYCIVANNDKIFNYVEKNVRESIKHSI